MRVQKVFNGHLRITNEIFLDAYENSTSTEFISLASQVKEAVSLVPGEVLCPACPSSPPCTKDSSHLCSQIPGLGVGRGLRAVQGRGHFSFSASSKPCLSPQLKLLYNEVPVLGPYHKKSAVTAFRCVLEVGVVGLTPVSNQSQSGFTEVL